MVGHDEEFQIEDIFLSPNGLKYRGRRLDPRHASVTSSFPVASVRPIPGVSRMGLYDLETGETTPLEEQGT